MVDDCSAWAILLEYIDVPYLNTPNEMSSTNPPFYGDLNIKESETYRAAWDNLHICCYNSPYMKNCLKQGYLKFSTQINEYECHDLGHGVN